jgi:hypothetical protein
MKLELRNRGEVTSVELEEGSSSLGAALEALMNLNVEGGRLVLIPKTVVRIDGVPSPAGVARWVLEGETIEPAEGVQLRLLPQTEAGPAPAGTGAILRALLGDAPEASDLACAHLTCLTGLDLGRKFHLARHRSELGRGEGVDVRIRDRAVSRKHARIRRTRKGFLLEDAGAPNGILVNGQRLRGPTLLEDGAVIGLGHSMLRFKGPCTEAASGGRVPVPVEPVRSPPPESPARRAPVKRPVRSELALICFGAALAVVGVVVTFGFAAG